MPERRVLVVEDNEQNLELVTYLLEEGGWQVDAARDAGAFEARLVQAPPVVVLMDMHLPGNDGLGLVAELRANPSWRSVPVIALTAHAMRGDRERFIAGGCDDYIPKPIDTARFAEQVEQIISRALAPRRAGGS